METGELAAEVIDRSISHGNYSELNMFSSQVEQQLKPKYMGYRIAENWLSNAWLNDFLIKRANQSDYLKEAATGIITESIDPKEIFSLKGLAKSIFH